MKTSLAKTFKDLSERKDTPDRIYPSREPKRIITDGTDESSKEIPAEQVFVIEPYDQGYISSKISTLLVNKELKEEYDEIVVAIDEKKAAFLKELKKSSGIKSGIEEIISQIFAKQSDDFLNAAARVYAEVMQEESTELSNIVYNRIFNEKVEEFLNIEDVKTKLMAYTKAYNQLLSSSTFFKKGVFNHYQASETAKNLKNHGFFKAGHSVCLNSNSNKEEITTEEKLEEVITKEKERILTHPDLAEAFREIDSKLTNQALRDFREYLSNNQAILPELADLELFKEKLWKSYFIQHKDLYKSLMDEYDKSKERVRKITNTASQEVTQWQEVINIFHQRFFVPFRVDIENKAEVILKHITPNIRFQFAEDKDALAVHIEKSDLIKVLSTGEKRALYILNIIFEVEARKYAGKSTLFIIDDIADSFDYRNKYAIIEYLNDILEQGDFYQIILTHNYDFYRTVIGRLQLGGVCWHAVRTKDSLRLKKDEHGKDIFAKWKDGVDNSTEILIAMIPFVRNLSEYCGHKDAYKQLTSLLHIKPDTDNITVADLQIIFRKVLQDKKELTLAGLWTIFKKVLQDKKEPTLPNPKKPVKELLYETADDIYKEVDKICNKPEKDTIGIELAKKIVLPIAIRLKTEEFLIEKIKKTIDYPKFAESLNGNQTIKLIKEYKKKLYANDEAEKGNIKLVDRVNLMTTENIHLNSFMYEPIIDMSSDHLKQLYGEIIQKVQS